MFRTPFPRSGLTEMPRKIYKLFISYDEAGAELRQHVAEQFQYSSDCVWQASFRSLTAADLPPGDGVVWVYPVFMQSGVTVTETLPELLRALYAGSGQHPELVFKPVWERDAAVLVLGPPPCKRNWRGRLPCWW